MYTKKDFKQKNNKYFIGLMDHEGNGWVDEEQLELILLELNDGVDDIINLHPSVSFVEFTKNPSHAVNFIHLN